jgi:HEAT repeat protein
LDDAEVRRLLGELKLPDKRHAAADRLAKGPANAMRDEVAKALGKLLNDPEDSTRSCAAKALVVWGTSDNVPALIKLLQDRNVFLKSDAIKALAALKDERGAEAIAKQLPLDRHNASQALQAMGPLSEPYVVPLLEDREEGVRTEACKILASVGTEKSRSALEALARTGRGFDAHEAEKALKQIASRQ